jgi:SAM-dependent methyltransferase
MATREARNVAADSPAEVLAGLVVEPLDDLGHREASLAGIFALQSARGVRTEGVTAQFLDNAADYHARYSNVAHFRVLIDDALATLDPPLQPKVILDIGSGSGNSVIPLLERFPEAFVVATDISPQLLAILRDYLTANERYRGRFALLCMDASHNPWRAGAFDLAVGAAILHHVLEPERVVSALEHALAPGGAAIFFEPFELGHAVLRLAYRDIVFEAARRNEDGVGLALVRQLLGDYEARTRDRNDPIFREIDDKWMFTRGYFESLAAGGGWGECRVRAIHGPDSPLREQTRINLALMSGADESALPDWAWNRLIEFESTFSPEARRDLVFEAAVIMRRSPLARIAQDGATGWWWNADDAGRGFFVDMRDGRACVVCCVYGDDGAPVWHTAGPAALAGGNALLSDASPARFANSHDDDRTHASTRTNAVDGALSLRFTGAREARLDWSGIHMALSPQHAENRGFGAANDDTRTGLWVDDPVNPELAVAVECLEHAVFAALLGPREWCVTVASRRAPDRYAGAWLRFTGGRTMTGPPRRPGDPQTIGDARLAFTEDALVIELPDGRRRALVRMPLRR